MNARIFRKSILRSFFFALKARPRLLVSLFLGTFVFFSCPQNWRLETRSLLGWDLGVFFYLLFVFHLAQKASPERIRVRARQQDDGAVVTLILSTAASVACFIAIATELSVIKTLSGADKLYHAIFVGLTIPMAWLFIHAMFALHYAHEYFDAEDSKGSGLIFPGDAPHSYWDFLYFSFILGTSAQTADVSISCPSLRKLALAHCILSFFFNITTLGLTINVASSLL